jgi:hypothetical protein
MMMMMMMMMMSDLYYIQRGREKHDNTSILTLSRLVRFEVLTAVKMWRLVFRAVTPCGRVCIY